MITQKRSRRKIVITGIVAVIIALAGAFSLSSNASAVPIVVGSDGHGHWHGSIFHCSGTPIDCHNP